MSGRDHSERCPKCGVWCGGLDGTPCNCPTAQAATPEGIDDEARAELLSCMQYMTGVNDGYRGPGGRLTIGQAVVALDARCTAAEKALADLRAAEPVEIHAETLIAIAAWCASDLSDGDVAAAVAEVRAFVAAADPTALICNAPPPSSREELGARIANLVPTDGELVCARCGSPWGMRHSETCKNVPAPVAAKERP